jgi:hypothetical protein
MSPDMSVVVHLLEAIKSRRTTFNGGELSVRLRIAQLALVDRNRSTSAPSRCSVGSSSS